MKYKTTILQTGNNTGIEISEKILEQLGGGKKPLVVVTINNYSYRSAVGKMGDRYMISLSAENRKKAGVQGGETHEVQVILDTEPRLTEVPDMLRQQLNKNKLAKAAFEKLAPSKKKAAILSITEAKTEATRNSRIEKLLASLQG